MKKPFVTILSGLLCSLVLQAQENNPLINSGEIIKEAVKLHDEGKYKEAISLYKKINRSDTNYVYAMYEQALSCSADSQYNEGLHVCELAIAEKADPERLPDLLTLYANLTDNTGRPERALAIYDSAIRLYPTYSPLYVNKGTTLLNLKRYAEAEDVFKKNLMFDPYAASSHYKLGLASLQTGKIIPAMISFITYLWVAPNGRYSNNCITFLGNISNYNPDIQEYVNNRKEESEEYKLLEQIIASKIALDKNFKPAIELDDPISRQMQVLFEKLEYNAGSKDFWMQYYVPALKQIYTTGKFEHFVNYIFSGVNLPQIQSYTKKKKKEIDASIEETIAYFNGIRSSRILSVADRDKADTLYVYSNGSFMGKGKITADKKSVGPWSYYYSPGNLKSTGILNSKEEGQGVWTTWYPGGALKGKQPLNDGKLDGEELFYYSNGQPYSKATYTNDLLQGEVTSYYYTGSVKTIAHYEKGKLNGERKEYYNNGNLKTAEKYVNNKADGPFSTWYENGVQESEGTYVNGELSGTYKAWHTNGNLMMEVQYLKDKPVGILKRYHPNGKPSVVQSLSDGKPDGEYSEYYDNGQLLTKYMYTKKGKANGDVVYMTREGKLYCIFTYDNDKLKAIKYFNQAGKTISTSKQDGNKLKVVTYRPDGTKRSEITYNEKGNTEGNQTYFYPSGHISETAEYSNGELDGRDISYYRNGKKSSELTYVNGKKDGYYTSYYSNGQVQTEGWYVDNLAEGQWLEYDMFGQLTARSYFRNGELNGYKEEFYPNGKKEYESKYVQGWLTELLQYDTTGKEIWRVDLNKLSGKYSGVHLNGKPNFESNYVNGSFEGPYTFRYFDGSLNLQQYFKKGLYDSTFKSYYYGGAIATQGQYKRGEKTGIWKYFRVTGALSRSEEYAFDQLNGHSISYFENGKPELDAVYKDNQRDGLTKKFAPDGNLAYQVRYEEGMPVAYSYMGKDGKPVPEIPMPSGNGTLKSYYSNGTVSAEYEYVDGKIKGHPKTWFPNGKPWEDNDEEYGQYEGVSKENFPSGQTCAVYTYVHDVLHGPYKLYYEKGTIKEEGNYYNGNYHGNVTMYDETGKVKAVHEYYYGKLLSVKK